MNLSLFLKRPLLFKKPDVFKELGLFKKTLDNQKLLLILSCLFSLLFNARIWQVYFAENSLSNLNQFLQLVCFFLFVFFLIVSIFYLFNFKIIQKLFLTLAFLVSAPALYFSLQFKTLFDESMILNVLETDMHEAMDLLTPSYWLTFIFLGLLPSLLIWSSTINYKKLSKQLIQNATCSALALTLAFISLYPYYANLSSFVRNNNASLRDSFLPYAPIHSLYKNLTANFSESTIVKQVIDPNASIIKDVISNKKPLILVVIVGETTREKSFALKDVGLENQVETLINRENLTYFNNFSSCGTNTAASVPCMFSTFSKDNYSRDYNTRYENVAEMISRVGYDVTWQDNNSGCKGICGRLKNVMVNANPQSSKKYLNEGMYYDEVLSDNLTEIINNKTTDQVIFLHQMGSHGPAYFKRTPIEHKIIQPACESIDFSKCSDTEIINAYNNSVLYSKFVIEKTIEQLDKLSSKYDTALIYVSDHGESTGEDGYYLHGLPYFIAPDEQTHIPALIWMSESYAAHNQIDQNCMLAKQSQPFSHDNFSHTLLGMLAIQSTVYQPELDLFDGCNHQILNNEHNIKLAKN